MEGSLKVITSLFFFFFKTKENKCEHIHHFILWPNNYKTKRISIGTLSLVLSTAFLIWPPKGKYAWKSGFLQLERQNSYCHTKQVKEKMFREEDESEQVISIGKMEENLAKGVEKDNCNQNCKYWVLIQKLNF